jgi:acyl-CoA thioesterase
MTDRSAPVDVTADGASASQHAMALAETTLTAIDRWHYEADLPEAWVALQGVHGGFVASLATRAVEAALDDPSRTLRAATFGLLRGLRPERATFHVEEIRLGRALATYHVTVSQDDGPPSILARCHLSPPWDGIAFSDLEPPMLTPPNDAVRLRAPNHVGHVHHLPTLVHPATTMFAGAPSARWLAWTRPTSPDRVDAAWLTMLGDYFPPAVTVRNTGPSRAVTIEYAIQLHTSGHDVRLGPDEHLACTMHAAHASAGFAVEDGTIWMPDGTLLATTRQTRLAG